MARIYIDKHDFKNSNKLYKNIQKPLLSLFQAWSNQKKNSNSTPSPFEILKS